MSQDLDVGKRFVCHLPVVMQTTGGNTFKVEPSLRVVYVRTEDGVCWVKPDMPKAVECYMILNSFNRWFKRC